MKASNYASLLTMDQGNRPDWTDETAYFGHEGWNYRLWAWQFLKRNPFYQKASGTPGPRSKAHAEKFGRVKMKHYKERYTAEDDANKCWLPECIAVEVCLSRKSVNYEIEPGEVLMVFDLRRTLSGGRAAISSMLANARESLYEEFAKFESALVKVGDPAPRSLKPQAGKFLDRLRMLDAMWKQATDDELLRVFYSGHYANGQEPDAYERGHLIRKVRDDQRAAIEMMASGYLELVPLDYLAVEPLRAKYS